MKKSKLLVAALALLCVTGFSSCEKETSEPTVETEYKEEDLANVKFYFKADVDGKTMILPEGKDGYESHAVAYEPKKVNGCADVQAMRLAKVQENGLDLKKSLEVSFVKGAENCMTDCSQIENMYKVGAYTYGKLTRASGETVTDGVVIRYTDVDGKSWGSDLGSGDQAGSSFKIVEHKDNISDSKSRKITTAEFNCKLYDGSGKVIVLTNAKIVSRSVQCGYLR